MAKEFIAYCAIFFFGNFFLFALAQDQPPDVQHIIDRVDKLFRSDSSSGVMEMTVSTRHWERSMKVHVWSEGMEKTFLAIAMRCG